MTILYLCGYLLCSDIWYISVSTGKVAHANPAITYVHSVQGTFLHSICPMQFLIRDLVKPVNVTNLSLGALVENFKPFPVTLEGNLKLAPSASYVNYRFQRHAEVF